VWDRKVKVISITIAVVAFIIVVPIIINELYKQGKGYETLWDARDVLLYLGNIVGTIFIGVIAITQNNRANEISDRLLKLEEEKSIPYLNIMKEGTGLHISINNFKLVLTIKNDTNIAINIIEIKPLLLCSEPSIKLFYCETSIDWYSLLPNNIEEISFSKNIEDDLIEDEEIIKLCYDENGKIISPLRIEFIFTIKLRYVNSDNIYNQKFKFTSSITRNYRQM
jgi:hypothetical protein